MMRSIIGPRVFAISMMLLLVSAAVYMPGCGGGGSDYEEACVKNPTICLGSARVTIRGSVEIPSSISLSRAAGLTSVQDFVGATVVAGHMYYSTAAGGYVTYDVDSTTTVASDGTYSLTNVPTDDNLIVTAYLTVGATTYTVNNVVSVSDAYAGGVVSVGISSVETTFAVKALELILEEYNENDTSSKTFHADDLSTTDVAYLKTLINSNLQAAVTAGTVTTVTTVLSSSTSLLNELDNLVMSVPALQAHVGQMTAPSGASPFVVAFSPADDATGVAYNGTTFKVIFSGSMDSTINYNTQATLTSSGFSIRVDEYSGSGSVTINYANALSYGTFAWATTVMANDTLTFTLKSSATLSGLGLNTLSAYTTYEIISFTVPTNLKSSGGLSLNTTKNMPSSSGGNYGMFTTASM